MIPVILSVHQYMVVVIRCEMPNLSHACLMQRGGELGSSALGEQQRIGMRNANGACLHVDDAINGRNVKPASLGGRQRRGLQAGCGRGSNSQTCTKHYDMHTLLLEGALMIWRRRPPASNMDNGIANNDAQACDARK